MSDQEDKDRFIEELRKLRRGLEDKDRAARLEDKDRAARLEELRFAKRQQWYIATSAVTLLAAIFGIAHVTEPKLDEKKVGTVFVAFIVYFAWRFLRQLQDHLKQTRKLLDPNDPTPWWRGVDILTVLVGIVVVSGLVVVYYLWRHDLPLVFRHPAQDWGGERWR
jgi:hypothetical protein